MATPENWNIQRKLHLQISLQAGLIIIFLKIRHCNSLYLLCIDCLSIYITLKALYSNVQYGHELIMSGLLEYNCSARLG